MGDKPIPWLLTEQLLLKGKTMFSGKDGGFSCGLVRKSSAQLSPFQALNGFSQTVPVPLIPSCFVPPAGAL